MPRKNLDKTHFANAPEEWTLRKHKLLRSIFIPAAMKMKKLGGVALIDGYAGPNEYGGKVTGSTVIMVEAAQHVIDQGGDAIVIACEEDHGRYTKLLSNLATPIKGGVLKVFWGSHASIVEQIQVEIRNRAALVFLDPQTSSQLTLKSDIHHWAKRGKTDVLGVFMGGDACRVCSSTNKEKQENTKMRDAVGSRWREVTSQDTAYEVYENELKPLKVFSGLYWLRKQEPKADAYGLFGLSDHIDGIWLLSEAIAKGWGGLRDFDFKTQEKTLFSESEFEDENEKVFIELCAMCEPFLRVDSKLSSEALGRKVLGSKEGLRATFGRFKGSDFTKAANRLRQQENQKGK